jgi:transglutaminase-like putative cysteine protease
MENEDRGTGKIWHIPGWHGYSDRRKLRYLRELAEKYGNDPKMRWWVVQNIFQGRVPPRDYLGQAKALLAYVQGLYYCNEPGEQIQSPWRTLAENTGDCDDLGILLAALATSVGIKFRWVIAGKTRGGEPVRYIEGNRSPPWGANFYHIYLQLATPALCETECTWYSAETTVRGLPLGHDVVVDGIPSGSGGSDLSYSGWGKSEPAPPDPSQDPELRAYLAEQNPLATWRDHGIRGLFGRVPWWDLLIGMIEGVMTSLAIAWVVTRRLK